MDNTLKEQIEKLKEKLENSEFMLTQKAIPDSIHVGALRDLIPEYIEDLNKMLKL